MISTNEALEISKKIEFSNIDIKKTIEKSSNAGYLGEKHFYCTVMGEGGFTHSVPEILGNRYGTIELGNMYYDVLSKALDNEGIYISLAYCNSSLEIPEEICSEIYEYDDYESTEDYSCLLNYALITSVCPKIFRIYEEEGIAGHSRTEDIGIVTKIIDKKYKTYFAVRSTDLCTSNLRVFLLNNKHEKEHPLSFENPINRMLIEMMMDVIVFNE